VRLNAALQAGAKIFHHRLQLLMAKRVCKECNLSAFLDFGLHRSLPKRLRSCGNFTKS
jgi:hypothetical protein